MYDLLLFATGSRLVADTDENNICVFFFFSVCAKLIANSASANTCKTYWQ